MLDTWISSIPVDTCLDIAFPFSRLYISAVCLKQIPFLCVDVPLACAASYRVDIACSSLA
jgi:hypothetical protein